MPRRQETVAAFAGFEPLFGARSWHGKKAGGCKSHRRIQLPLARFAFTSFAFLRGQLRGITTDADQVACLPAHGEIVPGGLRTLFLPIRADEIFSPGAGFLR